jgi:acyl-CoA dehydrogenase
MKTAFSRIQTSFDQIYAEIEVPGLGWLFKGPIALWSRMNRLSGPPSDAVGHRVAQAMQKRGALRDHITEGIYLPQDPTEAIGRYEHTLELIEGSVDVYKKLYKATKARQIPKAPVLKQLEAAVKATVITEEEAGQVRATEAARFDAILVDEFTLEEYAALN